MKAHVEAVMSLLQPLGFGIYFADVHETEPTYPYILLWINSGVPFSDTLRDEGDDLDEMLGVTAVAGTTLGVFGLQALIRGVLEGIPPTVTGRYVEPLKVIESRTVDVDRDVILPNTGRHPAFGVDMYRLSSTPA